MDFTPRGVVAAALVMALAVVPSSVGASQLRLPFDVELDPAGRVFLADGGRHQILRWDAAHRRLVVFAGSGRRGSDGDGGPATKARLDEPTCLAFDRRGNLYIADVARGVVRRIDKRGRISTVARVPRAAGVSADPTGHYLAIASLTEGVLRIDLRTFARERVAAVGEAGIETPHGVAYGESGELWIADTGGHVFRIVPGASPEIVANVGAFRVVPLADGGAYLVSGTPNGGRVDRLATGGVVTRVVGTGRLGPHADGIAATRAGILPSDVALTTGGTLLVTQTEPVPALRIVRASGAIATVIR
jgi:streptogramin lyase